MSAMNPPDRCSTDEDQREPQDARHHAEQLEHQQLVDGEVARVPGQHELARDLLAVALRREPRREARERLPPSARAMRSLIGASISWSRTSWIW